MCPDRPAQNVFGSICAIFCCLSVQTSVDVRGSVSLAMAPLLYPGASYLDDASKVYTPQDCLAMSGASPGTA
jgi:hypothetical protein